MSQGAAAVLPAPPAGPAHGGRGAELALWGFVGAIVLGAVAATTRGMPMFVVLALGVIPLVLIAFQRTLLSWKTLLGAILVVILFIPIRRYTIAGGGAVELEPYRILIALVLGCWLLALAADPDVRWRPTGYAAPITVLWLGILGSLAMNLGRVNGMSDQILKSITFFASYFLILFFVVSVVRNRPALDGVIKLLVGGSAIIAVCGLYEWRTGVNLFNGLGRFLPFLQYQDIGDAMIRGTGARALASAQHPIPLGAALVLMLPLGVYLFKRTQKVIWLVCAGVITLGALATGSRTAMLMMLVVFGTFVWLKRADMMRMLPLWIVLLVVIQGVMPGTLQSFKYMLNPAYMLEEQSQDMGTGSGRVADLGPSLAEWKAGNPFFGQGFGTRATSADAVDGAQILDNQWLGTLLEIGAVGLIGLFWLFCRAIRRLSRRAKSVTGHDSWLATALTASMLAWTIGLFTYDAFAFVQVTFFAFVILGLASVVLRADPER